MNIEIARRQMLDHQLRAWHVLEPSVLQTLQAVPRECFVPQTYRALTFVDCALPLPHGQHMLPPKIEGHIVQTLQPKAHERVLVIGAGSGYLAACLARQAMHVHALELFADIAAQARMCLQQVAANNVVVECVDALQWDADQAYDAIAVTGSLPVWEERWQNALKIGGRMFIVIGTAPLMEALKITRVAQQQWQRESLFETVLPPLERLPQMSKFVF